MSFWKRLGNIARGKVRVATTGGTRSPSSDERARLEEELARLEAEARGSREAPREVIERPQPSPTDSVEAAPSEPPSEPVERTDLWPSAPEEASSAPSEPTKKSL